jgi:myo-inositol 2-dehydrogenase / D-chiro-inositol 1-dehydrogenase
MSQPHPNKDNRRRDFLRESLILAAVPVGLVGNLAQAAAPSRSATEVLKIGLLGCGRRGLQLAKIALASQQTNVQLQSLADLFPDRVQQVYRSLNGGFGDRLSIDATSRFTGLKSAQQMAESDVDAVIVAAVPGFRMEHIKVLSEAGKQLYIERPFVCESHSTPLLAQVAAAAVDNGLAIQFGLQHRFHPKAQAFVQEIRQQLIGKPLFARIGLQRAAINSDAQPKRGAGQDYRIRNWRNDLQLSGGMVLEQLTGSLDLINLIEGAAPEEATCLSHTEHSSEVLLSYPSGLRLNLLLSQHNSADGKGLVNGLGLQLQGTLGWCDLLQGKIFDQTNNLIRSLPGYITDSQPAIETWLARCSASLAGSLTTADIGSLRAEIATALEANQTAILAQQALLSPGKSLRYEKFISGNC